MKTVRLKKLKTNNKSFRFSRTLSFFFLATVSAQVPGQDADFFLGFKRYSFIQYDKNRFEAPGDETLFDPFFMKLDSLVTYGIGKIQILHIGGSHIQADVYTNLVRQRFQDIAFNMNGGRGLIFPYKMAESNNPSNYKVNYTGTWNYYKNTQSNLTCSLGLTGMGVETSDSVTEVIIDPNKNLATQYAVNSIRIFHPPSSYHISVLSQGVEYQGIYDTIFGFTQIFLYHSADRVHLIFRKGNSADSFLLQGISLDNDDNGVVYNSVGVNGAKLESYLRCANYSQHLRALNPLMVIFSIGTNDSYTTSFNREMFRLRYKQLLDSTKKALPDALILLTVPNDSYMIKSYVNQNTEKIESIIYELAKEYDCGIWNFYKIMGGLNSSQTWYATDLMRYDRIHFNREGYLLQGDLFFSAFLKEWDAYLERKSTNDIKQNFQVFN